MRCTVSPRSSCPPTTPPRRRGMARFRRPDRRTKLLLTSPGYRAMGAVPARWRDRPHSRGRSPGHQPRAMGHRQAPGRGLRRGAGRACGGGNARSSSWATRNSRSIPSRAPIPRASTACATISTSAARRRPDASGNRPALFLPLRAAHPRPCRRGLRARTATGVGGALEHKAFHAERPGRVDLWPLVPSGASRVRTWRGAIRRTSWASITISPCWRRRWPTGSTRC
jgi:hypothetical protein